jgi:leucyl aminopeptidase
VRIAVTHQSVTDFSGDAIIVNLFKGVKSPGGATGAIDRAFNGIITKMIARGEINGKLGETAVIHTFGKTAADTVIIVGLGASADFGTDEIRKAAGAAIKCARTIKAKSVGTILHGAGIGGFRAEQAARCVCEGTLLALYTFTPYKKPETSDPTEFSIIEQDKRKLASIKRGLNSGSVLAECQNTARDLTNEPSNCLTPSALRGRVTKLVHEMRLDKTVRVDVLTRTHMKKLGMGALLSVAQGSTNEPQFIILRYKKSSRPLVALIGKTVTFDSGGISLKPAAGMENMKGDMSGGAAVIGATLALARTNAKVNLMTIVPAVENMPSGTASRPGDVVRAMNGKTIEIISTDAEGRMTLADALCYAEEKGAQHIIDVATLTGGCVVALGDVTAAVMGNRQKQIDQLLTIARETGEKHWQLPLFEEYKTQIKSDIADLKNSGGRKASTITAGLFLQSFVDKANWVHIDIAGKELNDTDTYYRPKGGTGFGVRTLYEFVRSLK